MTYEELAKYSQGDKIYLACKGLIFDVSDCEMYKEKGNYRCFAGKDASVALAKMNFGDDLMNPKLNHWRKSVNEVEMIMLDNWF